jgi:hypothetical protein
MMMMIHFSHIVKENVCIRIEKTQSVIIENDDDSGTPMQDSIEYSPHSPQYSPISYHNYSPPNHSPTPSTYEYRSDEDAVKRARMNDKQDKESSDEQESELTCLKSNEDDAEYALRLLHALENTAEAENDSDAIIAPITGTETRIEQMIENIPLNTIVNVESNISDVPVVKLKGILKQRPENELHNVEPRIQLNQSKNHRTIEEHFAYLDELQDIERSEIPLTNEEDLLCAIEKHNTQAAIQNSFNLDSESNTNTNIQTSSGISSTIAGVIEEQIMNDNEDNAIMHFIPQQTENVLQKAKRTRKVKPEHILQRTCYVFRLKNIKNYTR